MRSILVTVSLLSLVGCRSQLWDGTAPDGGLPYRAQAIRACTLAASCAKQTLGSFGPPLTISRCLDELAERDGATQGFSFATSRVVTDKLLQCSNLTSCASFRDCFGGDSIELSACREGAVCNGSVLSAFSPAGSDATYDCDALDYVCTELFTDAIRSCCTPKKCDDQFGTTCSSATRGTLCLAGATMPVDCGPSGQVCNAGNGTACRGTGPTCSAQTLVSCQGSVATYCAGERLSTFDCAEDLFRTGCVPGGFAACAPLGKQCAPFDSETCANGTIQFCADGFHETIDCKALGFAGCALVGAAAICN